MTHSNPISVRIAPDSSYQLSCVANGSLHQRVTISQNGKAIATFNGSGDGAQMKQQDGSTTLSGTTRQSTQLSLLFQNSKNGSSGPFQNSNIMVDSTAGIVTTIEAGDSSDGRGGSDTVLTLVVTSVAAAGVGQH